MTLLPRSQDYTDRDFDSLRTRLISRIKAVPNFSGWTDFQAADFGTLLLESFCFVGDVLGFNQDAASREAKWGTATQMRSLLRLCKQIGYLPAGQQPAQTAVTISAKGLQADVTIPAGCVVTPKGTPDIPFRTLIEVVLTPAAQAGMSPLNKAPHNQTPSHRWPILFPPRRPSRPSASLGRPFSSTG